MMTGENHGHLQEDKTTMVLNISLDHLKEEEIELILKVLERDATIQKQEDARKKRLRESVRGERIPEKRLSVKLRTGEWMDEMKAPSRAIKRRGTDIVRASIRRKVSMKRDRNVETPKSPTSAETPKSEDPMQNGDVTSSKDHVALGEPILEDALSSGQKSPIRRTSMRRKKPNHDKQVKFDTEMPEKFIYEQTSIDSSEGIPPIVADNIIPKIVVDSEETTPQPVEVTVITDEAPVKTTEETKPHNTFESYHNAFKDEMYKSGSTEQQDGESNETTPEQEPKGGKKIKVIKRKGSSRRKPGHATDDANASDEKPPEKDVEEGVTDNAREAGVVAAATGQKVKVIKRKVSSRRRVGKITDDSSRDTIFSATDAQSHDENADENAMKTELEAVAGGRVEAHKVVSDVILAEKATTLQEKEDDKNAAESVVDAVVASVAKDPKIKVIKRKVSSRRKVEKDTDDSAQDKAFDGAESKIQEDADNNASMTEQDVTIASSGESQNRESAAVLPQVQDEMPEEKKEAQEIAANVLEAAMIAAGSEQKIKVIKRKGSSRRRVGKITDDSSRDALFGGMESKAQDGNANENVTKSTVEPQKEVSFALISEIVDKGTTGGEEPGAVQSVVASKDNVYPVTATIQEASEQKDSKMIAEVVAKEYKKLLEGDAETISPDSSFKTMEMNGDKKSPSVATIPEEVKIETDRSDQPSQDNELSHSAADELDLGLGDVLATITEKYESMASEVKDALTEIASDINPFSTNDDLPVAPRATEEVKQSEEDNKGEVSKNEGPGLADIEIQKALMEMANESRSPNPDQDISAENDVQEATHETIEEKVKETSIQDTAPADQTTTPKEVEKLLDESSIQIPAESHPEVVEIAPIESSEKGDGVNNEHEVPKTDELIKKPVKKVIKKKKVEKSEQSQDGSPKSGAVEENAEKPKVKKVIKKKRPEKADGAQPDSPKLEQENQENVEGSPSNLSQLTRKKTVRKKVVRKAPPPSE